MVANSVIGLTKSQQKKRKESSNLTVYFGVNATFGCFRKNRILTITAAADSTITKPKENPSGMGIVLSIFKVAVAILPDVSIAVRT